MEASGLIWYQGKAEEPLAHAEMATCALRHASNKLTVLCLYKRNTVKSSRLSSGIAKGG